jgi:hypothetical protein
VAVVHSDGNGLGDIFMNFARYTGCMSAGDNRVYADKLRKFSLDLDYCTEKAFVAAMRKVDRAGGGNSLPLVPVVLGGDDMTVVCDGRIALQFARDFLVAFEEESGRATAQGDEATETVLSEVARAAYGVSRLSACAGIAIVKAHFPFSAAYDLSEDLLLSAKQVKKRVTTKINGDGGGGLAVPWPSSALDFHILYDSSAGDLDRIRARLHVDGGNTRLYGRPLVVTARQQLSGARGLEWVDRHHWEDFEERVGALLEKDEEGSKRLPNSQVHDLRSGLFLGSEEADARFRLIRHRYTSQNIEKLVGDASRGSLFWVEEGEGGTGGGIKVTGFLDAVDAADFLKE